MTRWTFADGRWSPVDFQPIVWKNEQHSPCENGLCRDANGNLYFSTRDDARCEIGGPWGNDPKQDIYLWRSTDNGRMWKLIVRLDRARYHGPVGLGRTTDGRVFFISNPAEGDRKYEQRIKLALWEVVADGNSVAWPVEVCDTAEFGRNKLYWTVDHPIPLLVRLADGRLHSVVGYRVRDQHFSIFTGEPVAQPTLPGVGTYAEEIVTGGAPIPQWEF